MAGVIRQGDKDIKAGYVSEKTQQDTSVVSTIEKGIAKMTDVKADVVGTKEHDAINNAIQVEKHVNAFESIRNSLAYFEFLTDPTAPIQLNPNAILNAGELQKGVIQGGMPTAPELYSTDPNKNQMYIAMATQIAGTLAGALGGDVTGGVMAGTQASSQAMAVAAADVEKRRTANDALQKAHQAAMSKYHTNLSDMSKTLMTQLGQNQRKALDTVLEVKKANQEQSFKDEKLKFEAQKAEVEKRVKMGEMTKEAAAIENQAIQNKITNLDNKKKVQTANANRKLDADYKSREIAKWSTDMSLKAMTERYKKYNLPMKLDKVLNYTLTPALASGRIGSGKYTDAEMSNSISFTTNMREVTNKLSNQYPVEQLINNPTKVKELQIIRDNMVNLMEYYNSFGELDEVTGQPMLNSAIIPEKITDAFFKTAKFQIKPLASNDITRQSTNTYDEDDLMRSKGNISAAPNSMHTVVIDLNDPSGLAKMDMMTITIAKKVQEIEEKLDQATVRTRAELEGYTKFKQKLALKTSGVDEQSDLAAELLEEQNDKSDRIKNREEIDQYRSKIGGF